MNKFLPFITEGSSAIQIYKTLLGKSQGIDNKTIADIFAITLSVGIEDVRNLVANGKKLGTSELYATISNEFHQHQIASGRVRMIDNMPRTISMEDLKLTTDKLKDFTVPQIMLFLLAVASAGSTGMRKEYSDIPFEDLLDGDKVQRAYLDISGMFSSTGEVVNFASEAFLESFVLCTTLLGMAQYDHPICAKFATPEEDVPWDPRLFTPPLEPNGESI